MLRHLKHRHNPSVASLCCNVDNIFYNEQRFCFVYQYFFWVMTFVDRYVMLNFIGYFPRPYVAWRLLPYDIMNWRRRKCCTKCQFDLMLSVGPPLNYSTSLCLIFESCPFVWLLSICDLNARFLTYNIIDVADVIRGRILIYLLNKPWQ